MQGLKVGDDTEANDDALLEEAIKLAAAEKEEMDAAAAEQEEQSKKMAEKQGDGCDHGYVKTEDHRMIVDLANTLMSGYISVGADADMGDRLEAADKATREKYPEMSYDYSNLKQVVPYFIANGTQKVLEGKNNVARFFASLACYCEECIAAKLHKTKTAMDATKTLELMFADDHTLVKYLKKRVPCKCLEEKYKEVKSITKMGLCCNSQCSILPDKMVARSKMLYCTRCRRANYCSRECQEADWPAHKKICDKLASWILGNIHK
jgi:hypothetical protein